VLADDRLELRGYYLSMIRRLIQRTARSDTWLGSTQNHHVKMVLATMNQIDARFDGLITGERS
jgi:hypothetical protein